MLNKKTELIHKSTLLLAGTCGSFKRRSLISWLIHYVLVQVKLHSHLTFFLENCQSSRRNTILVSTNICACRYLVLICYFVLRRHIKEILRLLYYTICSFIIENYSFFDIWDRMASQILFELRKGNTATFAIPRLHNRYSLIGILVIIVSVEQTFSCFNRIETYTQNSIEYDFHNAKFK